MNEYQKFLLDKTQFGAPSGFTPLWMPEFLFDFQKVLVEKAVTMGRYALFEDCGLGKTPQELVWAQNVVQKTNKPVLILEPMACVPQTLREAIKFQVEAVRSNDGRVKDGDKIVVTNYEKLHLFDWQKFSGCVCNESSILKNFEGERKAEITQFMRKLPYRLLGTATAAPNDFIELGTSSEALGFMGYMDMLGKFFRNNQNTCKPRKYKNRGKSFEREANESQWRFKGHAEKSFWQWVCSWSRAMRKPSDLGFSDDKFILPPLTENLHIVKAEQLADGYLFALPAVGLREQRAERRRSLDERCEKLAELCNHKEQVLVSCHLNPEGDLLEKLIDGAVQISGDDSDDVKEERLLAFVNGQARVLVSKDQIVGFGLNLQHCHRLATFPSHSYERFYQFERRCWRFGQTQPVIMDMVASEGELNVLKNLQRKAKQADQMFSALVAQMNNALSINTVENFKKKEKLPSWLQNK